MNEQVLGRWEKVGIVVVIILLNINTTLHNVETKKERPKNGTKQTKLYRTSFGSGTRSF